MFAKLIQYSFYGFQNITGAASFFYSDHISMFVNAGICAVMAVLNVLGFYMADRGNLCHGVDTATSPEKSPPPPHVTRDALPWDKSRRDTLTEVEKTQ